MHSRDALDDQEGNAWLAKARPLAKSIHRTAQVFHESSKDSLDCTPNQLSQIPRHNPQSQILSTSPRRRKRHDSPGLSDVPATSPNTANDTAENQILWTFCQAFCVFGGDSWFRRHVMRASPLTHWFPNLLLQ